MKRFFSLLCVLLASAVFSSGAQVYKWTDKDGKVHYSDKAPPADPGKPAVQKVDTGAAAYVTAPGSEPSLQDKEADFNKRRIAAREKQAQEDRTRQMEYGPERCNNARGHLKSLQDAGRVILRYDKNGGRIYADDNQRKELMVRAEQEVSKVCK